MDLLDEAIKKANAAGYAAFGPSENADLLYLTRFATGDPVTYFRTRDGREALVVSQMEITRALRQARCSAMTRAEAGLLDILKDEQDTWRAHARMIAGLVGGPVLLSPSAPAILASALQTVCPVIMDKGTVAGMRAVKTDAEIHSIQRVQAITDDAMDLAIRLIRSSREEGDVLTRGGEVLTSEAVCNAVQGLLVSRGCFCRDIIVSCGADSAMPHMQGSGPLVPGQPVVIDISPRDLETGYHSDMTRTVVKGEPDPEVIELWDAVHTAKELASGLVREGVSGADVHAQVVSYFRERGYPSDREGFTHNLGHGIGLEVHELPALGVNGKRLVAGNVVTVEPGLYFGTIGGVRIEDTGIVTAHGFTPLTRYPEALTL